MLRAIKAGKISDFPEAALWNVHKSARKVRVMMVARALMRRQEPGKAYGRITAFHSCRRQAVAAPRPRDRGNKKGGL
jgi:hypothetical protein